MNTADRTAATRTRNSAPKLTHRALKYLRQYWWLVTAVVVGAHLIAWMLNNPETQVVHWIFFTTHSSLGVVIAVAVILGAIFGHLISFQRRSGKR